MVVGTNSERDIGGTGKRLNSGKRDCHRTSSRNLNGSTNKSSQLLGEYAKWHILIDYNITILWLIVITKHFAGSKMSWWKWQYLAQHPWNVTLGSHLHLGFHFWVKPSMLRFNRFSVCAASHWKLEKEKKKKKRMEVIVFFICTFAFGKKT